MHNRLSVPPRETLLSPLLIKEMRSIMRGWRTFLAITLFLGFLAAVALFALYLQAQSLSWGGGGFQNSAGRAIFAVVAGLEGLLLMIMAPPLTASAIASERQRQTFDMLVATPLTPMQILWGKLSAALSYLVLMIVAALPINMVSMIYGGVGLDQVLTWFVLLLATVGLTGVLGLLWSTLLRSSAIASALTFVTGMFVLFLLPIGYFFFLTYSFPMGGPSCAFIAPLLFHPVAGLVAIVLPETELTLTHSWLLSLFYLIGGIALLALAEIRLSHLTVQRGRGWLWLVVAGLLLVPVTLVILFGPLRSLCAATNF